MEITEVRIKLMLDSDDRLQGFCSITFDNCFVVRDLKIIDGATGPFVAMPSRKLTGHCHQCGAKNHLKAPFCNQCGVRQREDRTVRDSEGRARLYADIAHPINSQCREMIQSRVIAEFRAEQERAKQPDYVSRYDDEYDDDIDADTYAVPAERRPAGDSGEADAIKPAGQSPPPPPHILPAAPPSTGGVSAGGPHFSTTPPREPNREAKSPPAKRQNPRSEFGEGVF